MRHTRSLLLAALAGLAVSTAVAMPPVMDRVPAESMVTVAIPDFDALQKDLKALAKLIGQPESADMLDQLLLMAGAEKGLKAGGALALVVAAPTKEQIEASTAPEPVLLVEVTNYADLVGNFGADKPSGGIDAITVNDSPMFAKDVGNGYAAISSSKEPLEGFSGKTGHLEAHKKMVGAAGDKLADKGDLAIVVNMVAARPLVEKMMAEAAAEMAARAAEMGGQDIPNSKELTEWADKNIIQESRGVVASLQIDNLGVALDMSLSLNEGSRLGKAFAPPGASAGLLNKLPAGPYLAALALDTSSPERKAVLKEFMELIAKTQPENPSTTQSTKAFVESLEKTDGAGVLIGFSPAGLMGGLLVNTMSYTVAKDPAAALAMRKSQVQAALDAKLATGKVENAAAEVNGVKVDSYEMRMTADPNNPFAAQASMMIFGPAGGPSGYFAAVDGGVVETYAKNSQLMGAAMKAAKGENTIAADKPIGMVAERLPKDRIAEVYVGIKGILDGVLPLGAMFMGVQLQVDIPQDLPPVGLAISSRDSVITQSIYLPAPVLKTLGEVAKQAQGAMQPPENEPGDKPPARQPGF